MAEEFQFTRPRGARRRGLHLVVVAARVSIHAPTGGATRPRANQVRGACVSIHAPTGGATPEGGTIVPRQGFNSRAHGGRDPCSCAWLRGSRRFQFTRPRGARLATTGLCGIFEVSIHAPTGGATPPARRRRRRQAFQFTRPRGARRPYGRGAGRRSRFNSRAHGGRDLQRRDACGAAQVSIHAPTGGATCVANNGTNPIIVSIHAPTGGATNMLYYVLSSGNVSIHAPTGGATLTTAKSPTRRPFQFTRPRGARRMYGWKHPDFGMFQFTRPRGARLP